jgi:hypothetical protein
MLSSLDIFRGALGAFAALAVALAGGCPTTTRLDFDELEENAVLDTEYDALGLHFVRGPLFGDLPAGPLPRAMSDPSHPAAPGKVLLIHPFRLSEPYPEFSLLWCRLDYPATRVQVTVGNPASGPVAVRLLYTDGAGNVTAVEKTVPAHASVQTVLAARTDEPEITAFAVYSARGVILVDNVIVDDVR